MMQTVNKVFALLIGSAGVIGGFTAGAGTGFLTAVVCIAISLFLLAATEISDILLDIEENTRRLVSMHVKDFE
ncbi:MAG: hypothetical protein HPY81_02810 [Firmicutes bacterium]|nr:hypothetical protein [Bacillota bacterium]